MLPPPRKLSRRRCKSLPAVTGSSQNRSRRDAGVIGRLGGRGAGLDVPLEGRAVGRRGEVLFESAGPGRWSGCDLPPRRWSPGRWAAALPWRRREAQACIHRAQVAGHQPIHPGPGQRNCLLRGAARNRGFDSLRGLEGAVAVEIDPAGQGGVGAGVVEHADVDGCRTLRRPAGTRRCTASSSSGVAPLVSSPLAPAVGWPFGSESVAAVPSRRVADRLVAAARWRRGGAVSIRRVAPVRLLEAEVVGVVRRALGYRRQGPRRVVRVVGRGAARRVDQRGRVAGRRGNRDAEGRLARCRRRPCPRPAAGCRSCRSRRRRSSS